MKPLLDAHNHLQDEFLSSCLDRTLLEMESAGIEKSVVNGTKESDWPVVAALAREHPGKILPSFGLHPWHVANRSSTWTDTIAQYLTEFPEAGVGECGLDRWIDGHDLEEQRQVFTPQISLASQNNRPLTIHCLNAWGPLLDLLQSVSLPKRGFLLHAYGGSAELISAFVELGAYFSFSGYFLHPRKTRQREVFKTIPPDRLLIETDAPAMPLPEELRTHEFPIDRSQNHPANLRVTFRELCRLREMTEASGRQLLDKNETAFFSHPST